MKNNQPDMEAILSGGPAAFFTLDAEGGVTGAGGAFEAITGYPPAEAAGKPGFWARNIHPDDADENSWAGGLRPSGPGRIEYRFRHKDGRYRWFHSSIIPVREEDGALACFCIDITKWKGQAADALQTFYYFRLIAENLTDMISLVDAEGRRLFCTPNYRMLGPQSLDSGRDSFSEIHPEDRERIKGLFARSVSTGEGQRAEYRFILEDGSVRHMESQGIVIKNSAGKTENVLLVTRDVTERKKTEEKQKALELKLFQADKLNALGKTLAGVAHELNNPLTGIMGYCQLLLREEGILGNTRHREDVESIFKEAERCRKIVKNLSTFARQHKPEKTYVGINDILEDALQLESYQLKVRGVSLRKNLAAELPKTMADFHQLQQVFLNLLVNAMDAMSGGPVKGELTVRTSLDQGLIRVEIEDNGSGIAPENLGNLFEPFFTTKEPGKGTGLGLSISYGIVTEHGGAIRAENREGGGARFVVELPVTAEAAAAGPERRESPARAALSGRVLIIDDESSIIDVLVRVMRGMNLSADTARDVDAAREKLEKSSYAAVISDYRLSGGSGLDLYNWVKARSPEQAARWIFITGSSGSETLPATDRPVLQKPFNFDELCKLLTETIRGS